MQPTEILTILSIGTIAVTVLFWLIDTRLAKMNRQFTPNGGTSMRDQLDRIEAKIDGHINWHVTKGDNR